MAHVRLVENASWVGCPTEHGPRSSGRRFGIKVHFRHFELLFGAEALEQALEFVTAQDHCMLITRRDHVAQTLGYYRAGVTGMWTCEYEALASQPYPAGCLLMLERFT